MALGKTIKRIREEKKLSQEDVSARSGWTEENKKIGISQGALSALEKRDSKSSRFAPIIAKALGVSLDDLMSTNSSKIIPSSDEKNKIPDDIASSAEWWPLYPVKKLVSASLIDTKPQRIYPRVVGTARMGDLGYYLDLEGGNGYIELEGEPGSIAIQVKGESMHPAIRDGWYVLIEPNGRPTPEEFVLLNFVDGRKMVKELLIERPDSYVVMSVNTGERITVMKKDLEGIQAISAVIPPSKHKP